MMPSDFRVKEFLKYHKLLMQNAPEGYVPYYFPVAKNDKYPDGKAIYFRAKINCLCGGSWKRITIGDNKQKTICTKCGKSRGSWKQPHARLTVEKAIGYIRAGYNIGLAARKDDPLICGDLDNLSKKEQVPLIDNTLSDKSRKRCGHHFFMFKKEGANIPNIATNDDGEIRSDDQYVLIPGSYVETSKEDILHEFEEQHITKQQYDEIINDPLLGYYTVYTEKPCLYIDYNEIPAFYKEIKKEQDLTGGYKNGVPKPCKGLKSALFDLSVADIISKTKERFTNPLHGSKTGMNYCIDENGLGHCWRCNVSHNGYQFLVAASGFMTCEQAGKGHNGTNLSNAVNNPEAVWHAWYYAKKNGYLSEDDPIPISALKFLAVKHNLVDKEPQWLDPKTYNQALKILEDEY